MTPGTSSRLTDLAALSSAAGRSQIGKEIRRLQEAALEALPLNKLYIGLWIRDDPPQPNNFHWGFYYHTHKKGGTKYHITNIGRGWIGGHGPTSGVFKSLFLCVLIEIGSIPAEKEVELDRIMRSEDDSLNSIVGVSCRVWIFAILPHLIETGLLRCDDLDSLQQECFGFGNAHMMSAKENDQPYWKS